MIHWLVAVAIIWAIWHFTRKPKLRAPQDARDDTAAARALLGVDRSADADTIRSAHRRLAAQVHPDRGGSAEDARRVNAARDLLLDQISRA